MDSQLTQMKGETTTIKVYIKDRDILAKEIGKYNENMADIVERVVREFRANAKSRA